MKIGILAAGTSSSALQEQFGSFALMTERMLSDAQFSFKCWDVRLGEFPQAVNECDGWIITGSPCSAYESLEWIADLESLIRAIDQAEVPLIGICFGHQLIAQALGGVVVKADAGWGVGVDSYQPSAAGQAVLGSEPVRLHIIHQDQVIQLPARAEILAASAFCQYGVLRYGSHIFTVQAHPEFSREYMLCELPAIVPEYLTATDAEKGLKSLEHYEADSAPVVDAIIRVLMGKSL
ncbi:GMP synthase-Glutamine amidotransferase [Amphritea atlantica]|uniref:GMP synthase-Glutamine amidotransferase n=1 Tax=Amphritea atlantica TaxID=355243 RepID=A0A1H9D280_9GAMM|nr:type 1 glutamine amidotransferase [Amphritea atlantica]SEQ07606.1 GMP synthase-Glutamine amidotransferase [Amphritea atlantica]